MAYELLRRGNFNIICVDWKKDDKTHITERIYARDRTQFGGYIGKRLNKLGRITGLDPASPYFESTHPVVRLDPSDAIFTRMQDHVDFYPNGGTRQPGCSDNIIESILYEDITEYSMSLINLWPAIKCFGELGCFPVDGPFRSAQRPISVAPFAPHVINSNFLLYTRASISPQVFSLDGVANATFFSAWRQSKVIIHGFQEDGFSKEWIRQMVGALLRKADFNVFVVDWANGAQMPYHQAVANARVVGSIVARLIRVLQMSRNATSESFHLIGHSLGAHIAGYAGQLTARLGRITGLDPAQPYFENTAEIVRLDPSDASLVDVIHTDAAPLWRGGMGMSKQCGHLDFYPNGGKSQPGCKKLGMKAFFNEENNFVFGMRQWLTCNHKRAYTLFTESIGSECLFISIPCRSYSAFRRGECFKCGQLGQDCSLMGFKADGSNKPSRKSIKYFLHTSSRTPHCRKRAIKLEFQRFFRLKPSI
uniref:Lipase domain-containing protein n=1 Tax=Strigamia maritima TaxID=126957 RepID=T1JA75_STRMM